MQMKHLSLAALLLPLPCAAHAQDEMPPVKYPAVPATAADAKGFVPAGWKIVEQASGDLDGAGAADLALVVQAQDPANILRADMCGDTLDTNPYMTIVALAGPGGYRRVVANHVLLPRRDNACALHGLSVLEIKGRSLHLFFERMMSAGGGDAGNNSFNFQWRGDAMRLIGFDYIDVQRYSGEMKSLSVNYLTRKVKTSLGRIDSDKEAVRWTRLRAGALPTLDQVGDALEYDPQGLVTKLSG
jgi:hypothetical protein